MKTRQKRKNAAHGSDKNSRSEMIGRSLSHLNRSIRQFSDGLQTRMSTLQERLLVEPLESAAWGVSQRVRKVQNRVFDFIDEKISMIEEARHRKLDHQTALERFDDEGGSMQPTQTVAPVEAAESPDENRKSSRSQKFAFEPTLSV
jgi:hypothetical protein